MVGLLWQGHPGYLHVTACWHSPVGRMAMGQVWGSFMRAKSKDPVLMTSGCNSKIPPSWESMRPGWQDGQLGRQVDMQPSSALFFFFFLQ